MGGAAAPGGLGGRRGDLAGRGAGFGARGRGGRIGVAATARRRAEISCRHFQMTMTSGLGRRLRLPCSAMQFASHVMMAARRSAGVAGRVSDMGASVGDGGEGRARGLRFGEAGGERGQGALLGRAIGYGRRTGGQARDGPRL